MEEIGVTASPTIRHSTGFQIPYEGGWGLMTFFFNGINFKPHRSVDVAQHNTCKMFLPSLEQQPRGGGTLLPQVWQYRTDAPQKSMSVKYPFVPLHALTVYSIYLPVCSVSYLLFRYLTLLLFILLKYPFAELRYLPFYSIMHCCIFIAYLCIQL